MQSSHYSFQILTKLEFSNFQKILKKSNFTKICPVAAELFHADGHE